jgi:hypothetical protein
MIPPVRIVLSFGAAAALYLGASSALENARAARQVANEVERHVVVPEPHVARILSMGHTELAADVSWVRMLIYYGDGIFHKTGMPDTDALVRLVTVLDPHFRRPYVWGAYATVMKEGFATQDEYESSLAIARAGVAAFPDDWELNWILGVRLYLEIKGGTLEEQARRHEEGAMYIERAMRSSKAPSDMTILAATIRTNLGQKELALRDLREMILNTDDVRARDVLEAKYAALASETAGKELADEARRFDDEWRKARPYAPRTWHVLVGLPPPSGFELEKLVDPEGL